MVGVEPMESAREPSSLWDIALPSRRSRLSGVTMAGFSDAATDLVDLQVVPHPAVMLIFNLGDTPIVVDDAAGQQQRDSVVVGLAPIGARGHGGRSFECLQVRLSPLAAHTVLGAASELGRAVVSLDNLWGRDAVRIQEQMRAAVSWDDRFAIADAALARRNAGRAVDPEVASAWGRMLASRGRIRVEQLAADVGWSRKRLWSRFGSQIGLNPKRAIQLIRFDVAAHRLAGGYSPAEAAAEGGYVDQSHLHRDVVAFTGQTPTSVAHAPFLAVDDIAWPGAKSRRVDFDAS